MLKIIIKLYIQLPCGQALPLCLGQWGQAADQQTTNKPENQQSNEPTDQETNKPANRQGNKPTPQQATRAEMNPQTNQTTIKKSTKNPPKWFQNRSWRLSWAPFGAVLAPSWTPWAPLPTPLRTPWGSPRRVGSRSRVLAHSGRDASTATRWLGGSLAPQCSTGGADLRDGASPGAMQALPLARSMLSG